MLISSACSLSNMIFYRQVGDWGHMLQVSLFCKLAVHQHLKFPKTRGVQYFIMLHRNKCYMDLGYNVTQVELTFYSKCKLIIVITVVASIGLIIVPISAIVVCPFTTCINYRHICMYLIYSCTCM